MVTSRPHHIKHPYKKYKGGKVRTGRPRAHFTFNHTKAMQVSQSQGDGDAKRHKSHEAHMIPGLSPRVFGFPNSIITTLKYVDTYLLVSTAGAVTYQVMSANGIFDPDLTSTGHQPLYRDNYAAIYDVYTVLGSKCIVRYANHRSGS